MDKDRLFEITKIENNIKNHDFSVQNYRMTKEEADIVLPALDAYRNIVGSWVDKDETTV